MGVMPRPRLLPIVAVAATMLLGFKVSDLVLGNRTAVAPPAHAQAASPQTAATTNPPAPATASSPNQAPASASSAPSQPPKAASGAAAASDAAASPTTLDAQSLNPSEIEVLQQLSQRRAELDKRAADLDQREVLLQATEKRIDDKIAKLQELENSIASDVQKQGAEDDARIQSLVKIYEAMKPKDAAQIFEQLDMPILLRVLQGMKERKTAPILEAMDPEKAKAITTALATKRGPEAAQGAPKSPSAAAAPNL